MTRFARAEGSKASNKRVPEEATSWSDMKKQITDKNPTAKEENPQSKSPNKSIKETDEKKSSEWCSFPDEDVKTKKNIDDAGKVSKKKKTKKLKKNKVLLDQNETASQENKEKTEDKTGKETNDLQNKNKKVTSNKTEILYNKKGMPYTKKIAKIRDNQEHKSRKPNKEIEKFYANGRCIEIIKYDGFPVMKEDFERLVSLRKSLVSKGIPKSEVKATMLKERRKAEKAFAREKKKVCFQCRKSGHVLSECPELGHDQAGIQTSGTGMCFKCGSTEHTHFECKVVRSQEFKFAECFICKEKGHIARQCPDNPRGLYPKGGGCRECGSVTHLKKDCPKTQQENDEKTITLSTQSISIEGLENDVRPVNVTQPKKNIIKF